MVACTLLPNEEKSDGGGGLSAFVVSIDCQFKFSNIQIVCPCESRSIRTTQTTIAELRLSLKKEHSNEN